MTEAMTHERPGKLNVRLASAACAVLALVATAGCSHGTDDAPKASGVPAARVCDSTLDTAAAAALEQVAGAKRFKELTGANDAGVPYKFSLKLASEHLHGTSSERNTCSIYKADDKSGKPLLDLDFEATDEHPDRSRAATDEDLSLYPIGLYASTEGNLAANLFFSCASDSAGGKTKYVKASMFSAGDQLGAAATAKDRMTILTSVSRALAEKLGCADEARLPATVPDGRSVTP